MHRARLTGASLKTANFTDTNLVGAYFAGTELQSARLRRAHLQGVDFRGATFAGKLLWSKRPLLQIGNCGREDRATIAYLFEDEQCEPMITCGCFEGTLTEFQQRIATVHTNTFHAREYNEMVEYIRRLRQPGIGVAQA